MLQYVYFRLSHLFLTLYDVRNGWDSFLKFSRKFEKRVSFIPHLFDYVNGPHLQLQIVTTGEMMKKIKVIF